MNIRFESLKGWIGETFATRWEHHHFWFEKIKKWKQIIVNSPLRGGPRKQAFRNPKAENIASGILFNV